MKQQNSQTGVGLRRHVPELAIEWQLDCPNERHRAIEGTLCFADISGFTALAERLAQRGRMGGEELVETLGRVFASMLEIVHERRGELLKFGGDALLLFFRGDDHARQAASAAVEMRQALRKAREIPTSVGPLNLSMSVGLHTGEIDFFLVGSTHKELVLLGPETNSVVDVEGAAEAGQILVSAATELALPAGATRARDDGEKLLRWRKAPISAPGPLPPREAEEAIVQSLFPKALGDYLSAGVPDPEHRVACIAFVKFSGTDAVLVDHGYDALAEALERTISHAQSCLDAESATLLAIDVDKNGGKLFLGAGVPFKHEDDEGVVLRALKNIAKASLPLQLQFGVNRGHVFAAEVGAPGRAAYSAMGDTTNTAARICGKAPIGEIYAHPEVLDECLTLYETKPSPPLTMKGKKMPLVVYQLGEQLGTRRREGLDVAEFLGRKAELTGLLERLAALQDGQGGVIAIEGETGMGKSKLIRHALASAGLAPLLDLRGEPNTANSAYALFSEPLRNHWRLDGSAADSIPAAVTALIKRAAPERQTLAPLIGELVGAALEPTGETTAIEPQFRAARAGDLLSELLAAEHTGPQVYVVDDAQWCDEASSTLLSSLATRCAERPWLLIVSRRPGPRGFDPQTLDGAEDHTQSIPLGPMSANELTDLLHIATEAAPLRPHELGLLVTRSGGNPMHALEFLRTAREAGSFDAVPESLEAAMATQVDALDSEARRLLRYASVLGRRFSRPLLEETLSAQGHTLDDGNLERLAEFIEIEDADHFRFRNDVIRDAAYEAVSYRRRQQLHQTVGETMERLAEDKNTIAETLAYHFSRSDDHKRAWKYASLAGDRARARYANAEAARLYHLALQAAREIPELPEASLGELLIQLGEVDERAGMFEDALDSYQRALKLAGDDPLKRAKLFHDRAMVKDRIRNLKGAVRDLRQGLKFLEPLKNAETDELRAELQVGLAWMRIAQDQPTQALEQARLAESLARASDAPIWLGHALTVIDLATEMLEGPGDGACLKEAHEIFGQLGEERLQAGVEANLGFLCAVAGDLEEGVGWLRSAQERFKRVGDVVQAADPALNLGEMMVKQRRYDEAEPVLLDAIRVLHSVHYSEAANRGEAQYARILIERGQLEDAEQLLERVQSAFEAAGQHLAALEAACIRVIGLARAGEATQALELLETSYANAGPEAERLLPVVACERGRLLAQLNKPEEAHAAIQQGLVLARDQSLPYEEAMLLELKAELKDSAGQQQSKEESEILERLRENLGIAVA